MQGTETSDSDRDEEPMQSRPKYKEAFIVWEIVMWWCEQEECIPSQLRILKTTYFLLSVM